MLLSQKNIEPVFQVFFRKIAISKILNFCVTENICISNLMRKKN